MNASAASLALLLVAASVTLTVIVDFPGTPMCRSDPLDHRIGPLHVESGGNCDLLVECTNFAHDVCE